MLKIKEDKMQELEKFGFEENIFGDYSKYLVDTPCKLDVITVDRKTRQIRREIKEINTIQVICKRVAKSCIDDLIKNDMVEKDCEQKLAEIKGEKDD